MSGPERVGELYFDIEMRTAELDKAATRAEQTIDKLGTAAKKAKGELKETGEAGKQAGGHLDETSAGASRTGAGLLRLVPAAGAAAAAIGLVAAKAIEVGSAFDYATRKAAAASPALRRDLGKLQEGLLEAALETKRTVQEVSSLAESIARQGVSGTEDLLRRVKVSSDLAKVTGESVEGVAAGLDQTLDVFALSDELIGEVANRLFALAETGVPLGELFRVLQAAAPTLRDAGIGFDEASAALAQMINEGRNARQAAAEFKALVSAGEEGIEAIRRYASELPAATRESGAFADALHLVEGAADSSSEALEARLSVALARIGRAFLPVKIAAAEAAAAVLEFITFDSRLGGTPTGAGYVRPPTARTPQGVAPGVLPTIPGAGGSSLLGAGGAITPERLALLRALTGETTKSAVATTGQGAAARAAAAGMKQLQEIIAKLTSEVLPATNDRFAALRQRIEEAAAAAGKGGAAKRQEAEQLLMVLKALDGFKTTVAAPPPAGLLEVAGLDLDAQAEGLKEIADEWERFFAAGEDGRRAQELIDTIGAFGNFARDIAPAIAAVGELGATVGLLGDDLAEVVGQFAALTSSAGGLGQTISRFKAGNANLGELLGSSAAFAMDFAGAIASAFEESPAVREATAAIEANVEALKENSALLTDIRASGSEQSRVREAAGKFVDRGLPGLYGGRTRANLDDVTKELDKFGLSMDDLRDLADDLGINFVELTRETMPQFLAFLEQLGIQLEQTSLFGSGFAGALNELTTGFKVNGTDAAGQFADLVTLLTDPEKGAPAIFDALKGIDISTESGAAAAREALRGIFGDLELFEDLDFNGLTQSEAVDAILQLLGILPDFPAARVRTIAEDFAEAVSSFNRAVRVFDLSPMEQAEQFIEVLGDFAPDLAAALAGFDLSTADGLAGAIAFLQDFFLQVESGEVSLEGLGFTLDDLVTVIDMLQGVAADAADEVERLAQEEADRAAQATRDAEREAEDARREAERAAERARQAAEQEERDRVATGDRGLRVAGDQAKLFDISGNDLLKFKAAVFDQGSGGLLSGITGGADLGSAGGQAAALEALKGFFLSNPNGTDAGVFGADAVRSQVLDLAELLKAQLAVSVTGGGANESFGFSRNITEAGADRISGQLGTIGLLLEDILDVLFERLASPLSPVTLSTPALPAAAGQAGASVGSIVLYLSVGGSTPVPGTLTAGTQNGLTELVRQIVRELNLQSAGG